jgi:small subunit ribosomal protein S17
MTDIQAKNKRQTGKVISNKMDKTITVFIERLIKHPLYGKYIKKSTKLHAHDEKNQVNIGDIVTIEQCKPISKLKCWELIEIHTKK